MKSRVIAISAVSAAFIATVLTIGAYVEIFDLVSIVLAGSFAILPIYYKSYKGAFLAFLSGGVIAFLFSGFNVYSLVFVPYIVFFGIYPIIKCYMDDKSDKKVAFYIIGAIWSILAFYGMYFYYVFVMGGVINGLPEWLTQNILYFIWAVALAFYCIFERYVFTLRKVFDRYLYKIIK